MFNCCPDQQVLKISHQLKTAIHGVAKRLDRHCSPANTTSVEQPPIKARPSVPISVFMTLGTEVQEQMFGLSGQSDTKPSVLSSKASFVLIYRPTEGMKGWVGFVQPGVCNWTCGLEA
ncbi:hypothetical protein TNCV_4247591 [Trichonephila clavipes]|nr:hypothetical protein TNCV_4247591 [Trichonephila clavipes]